MAGASKTFWEIIPANRLPGDDGQILIVDREDGAEGRTVCLVPGKLLYCTEEHEFVRHLDEQDFRNARLFATAPRLRAVLTELLDWAAQSGEPDAECWEEARRVAAVLQDPGS
ncbi:hypothetical protein HN018_23650 (plasmid) [Lichenicola cladoniae]|uniref:Uncharacterized protein n=1 Tax=Lichenicola cladoniae TaxID=1484109 RepID=A0A6M8HXR3_9PROT|nr:hypothetical protein [Lichenicola cladoniae]NPD66284.1 hypothetical protein [Acetobacteraceae bacterium]QKE93182.1 hypothetical protein HN018_23650 [Lichenicola cladoniae]